MTARLIYRLSLGVGALTLALSSMVGACKGKDCADERIGQKRCVGNRLETCGPNNELSYDSCTDNEGLDKYCSAAHKACVTKEIFDAQTVGSSSSGGEGGSTMSAGGMGGAGGEMMASSSVASSSAETASSSSEAASSSAMSSSAATGGGDLMLPLNGCDPTNLVDKTADPVPVVLFSGIAYDPPCMKIKQGQSVIFVGAGADFTTHPLYGGLIDAQNQKFVDMIGPITPTTMGSQLSVSFNETGAYGFFCDFHYAIGMKGAIYVVPAM